MVLGLAFAGAYTLLALAAAIAALINRRWADLLDPGKDAIAGVIGFGGLIVIWRKYGWLALKENESFQGYALSRAIEDWQEAQLFAQRLDERVRHAQKNLQHVDEPRAKERSEAERLAREADQAKAKVQETWKAVGTAMQAVQASFREDAVLTKDWQKLFSDHSGESGRTDRR